jgi:hypothetical protein
MAKITIGDRVRIKDREDWPKPPGYRFTNSEGTVVKWVEWQELLEDFQSFAYVHIEKSEAKEYIGSSMYFLVESLEKI